jgi:NAD-dependent deacetylase
MNTDGSVDAAELVEMARAIIGAAQRVTVLTGAGISTSSGIPDFRGPNGVWTKNPAAEKMATLSHYLAEPEVRKFAWQNRVNSPAWDARPNAGHLALVDLERSGRLHALITQNIDELHQRAGNDPSRVIEVHGTMFTSVCWGCGDKMPMAAVLERVRAGEEDPACLLCSGVLKSDTISFGQSLVPAVIDRAMAASEACDVFLAIGSTLSVFPAANTVPRAKAAGAKIVIVNGAPTEMDRYADVMVMGDIGEVLPRIVGVLP